jgi:hypothetical protein
LLVAEKKKEESWIEGIKVATSRLFNPVSVLAFDPSGQAESDIRFSVESQENYEKQHHPFLFHSCLPPLGLMLKF